MVGSGTASQYSGYEIPRENEMMGQKQKGYDGDPSFSACLSRTLV